MDSGTRFQEQAERCLESFKRISLDVPGPFKEEERNGQEIFCLDSLKAAKVAIPRDYWCIVNIHRPFS